MECSANQVKTGGSGFLFHRSRRVPASRRPASAGPVSAFPWLPTKEMLRVSEVAEATGMRTTYVEEWFARRCHRFPSAKGNRPAMRIPRVWVVDLMLRSAQYNDDQICGALASTFPHLGLTALEQLGAALAAEIDKRKAA